MWTLELEMLTRGTAAQRKIDGNRRKLLTRSILIQVASERPAGLESRQSAWPGEEDTIAYRGGPAADKWLHGLIGCCKNSLDRFATGYLRYVQKEQSTLGHLIVSRLTLKVSLREGGCGHEKVTTSQFTAIGLFSSQRCIYNRVVGVK